jgi:chromosomal replication initiator protein
VPQDVVAPRTELAALKRRSDRIIDWCASIFGVSRDAITGPARNAVVVRARDMAIYQMAAHTTMSASEIGRRVNRDHSTVLYSISKMSLELGQIERFDVLKRFSDRITWSGDR